MSSAFAADGAFRWIRIAYRGRTGDAEALMSARRSPDTLFQRKCHELGQGQARNRSYLRNARLSANRPTRPVSTTLGPGYGPQRCGFLAF